MAPTGLYVECLAVLFCKVVGTLGGGAFIWRNQATGDVSLKAIS